MASLFDVFKQASFGDLLQQVTSGASRLGSGVQSSVPGGANGLIGAGLLGAILGNNVSGDTVRNVALLGAGAVAWNFYRKWKADKEAQQSASAPVEAVNTNRPQHMFGEPAGQSMRLDSTALLVLRAMMYAVRADGSIDQTERKRVRQLITSMMGNVDVSGTIDAMEREPIDPARIAEQVTSMEQAEDVYRLSCIVIDIDHFLERSYLDALARALGISQSGQQRLEEEAIQVKAQLR